ncbi:MAG: hypothetical protein JWO31_3088 [Phycisphaerales bacterium]|nr:hypothetical protein [Phycisphaerales bacterium]
MVPGGYRGVETNAWAGSFAVTEYAIDSGSGVYLLTGSTQIGFIEARYFGFARRLNRTRTPLVEGGYRLGRLAGDWCWFAATTD